MTRLLTQPGFLAMARRIVRRWLIILRRRGGQRALIALEQLAASVEDGNEWARKETRADNLTKTAKGSSR
ncbi:hypothetical protein [Comamonas serinivorans]|uniref:hypothetical protein n=1 Tax=Comamonas serinivorans TaxID=1082851 RepID=UPI0012F76697|nr:hypothetical protein [Comamonas serinivorans]